MRGLSPRTMRSLASTAAAVFAATDDLVEGAAPEINVGGSVWIVERHDTSNGAGVMGPGGGSATHQVDEVYIMRQGDPRLESTPLGTQIADSEWYLIAPLGTDLEPGDLLKSVQVPGVGYRVTGLSISLSEARLEGTVDEVSTVVLEEPEP